MEAEARVRGRDELGRLAGLCVSMGNLTRQDHLDGWTGSGAETREMGVSWTLACHRLKDGTCRQGMHDIPQGETRPRTQMTVHFKRMAQEEEQAGGTTPPRAESL